MRKRAILNPDKKETYNLTEAFKDNVVLDYAGARGGLLHGAAGAVIGSGGRMNEVKRHIERTSFAWIGGAGPTSVFYYRVHSPVILIEFDHQRPANLARFAEDPTVPARQHIHCVVRTPNGNDYGKDLLRQHYLAHPHV